MFTGKFFARSPRGNRMRVSGSIVTVDIKDECFANVNSDLLEEGWEIEPITYCFNELFEVLKPGEMAVKVEDDGTTMHYAWVTAGNNSTIEQIWHGTYGTIHPKCSCVSRTDLLARYVLRKRGTHTSGN